MINRAMPDQDVRSRLFIDSRCGVHLPGNYKHEQDLKLHEKMGSTGHGVMSAIVDKMSRSHEYQLFSQMEQSRMYEVKDTVRVLNNAYDNEEQILIEGTQGTLLDFHLGFYPFVTTRQTVASNWLAECGLSPNLETEVHMVIRTLPIRVAGNSGYMGDEIRWVDLATQLNNKLTSFGKETIVDQEVVNKFRSMEKQVLLDHGYQKHPFVWEDQFKWQESEFLSKFYELVLAKMTEDEVKELKKFFEITTVTKKLRRIADFNVVDFDYAMMLNRPDFLHVNFLNYLFPSCWNVRSWEGLEECIEYPMILDYLRQLTSGYKTQIQTVNCAPDNVFEPHNL